MLTRFRLTHKILTLGALLLVVALVAAACSDPDPTSTPVPPAATVAPTAAPTAVPPTDTPVPPTDTPVPPTPTPAPTATPEAMSGGHLIAAVSADTGLRDGHQITAGTEMRLMYPNFDRLFLEEADGSLTPEAATGWEVSGDGLEFLIDIREGMTFHDGTPVDGEAVLWNFNRQMDPEHPQGQGGGIPIFICSWILFDPYIESVEQTGSHQIKMTLKETLGPIIAAGSLPCGVQMSPTAAAADLEGFLDMPTGSGPFVLVDAELGEQTVYERNDNYWNGDKPLLDQLTWVVMPEAQTRWAAIQNGTIHLATELNAATIREAEADANINVDFPEARHFAAIWPNQSEEGFAPFQNPLVRQAMASAINKEKLVADILDPIAYVAHGPIPSRSNIWANHDIPRWPHDPDRARELLAEAGYPDGIEFSLLVPSGGAGQLEPRDVATVLQADLAAVGINMQLEVVEFGTLYQGLQDGQHDAFLYGITYWMAEPWNQLSLIHQTGQFSNWGRYSNPALDELMAQADRAPTFEERKPIYDEVQIALSEEQAFVYLYHEVYAMVRRSEVQGEIGFTGNYAMEMEDVWVK